MGRRDYLLKLAVLTALAGSLAACNSGDTGSSGEPDRDSFVSSDDQVGSIDVVPYVSPLAVGEKAPFRVEVKDRNGAAVPNIRVSCDSEKEIAILEPTLGYEMTDAWGHMSGVYGCVAAGSFQLACRLPIGANKRDFVTIVCTGDPPAGFSGWPNAAGGTLGGGVDNSDEDDPQGDGTGVRITSISFTDAGNANTTSIDAQQVRCGTAEPAVYEFFTDALVTFTVVNNSDELVRFDRYSYTVPNFDGAGGTHFSPAIALTSEVVGVEPEGGEATFTALFMDALGGGKSYFNTGTVIPSGAWGFKNARFTLYGTTAGGEDVQVDARSSFSLDNFNNCG